MLLVCFLSFFIAAVSANNITYCPKQTISVTTQWELPMAPMAPNNFCTYNFAIPPNSYADLSIFTIDMASSDSFFIQNPFGDRLVMDKNTCSSHCHNMTTESRWPGNFSVTVITGKKENEGFQFQISINVVPFDRTANVKQYLTAKDLSSKLFYFKDWKMETSYTVKSNSSKIYLQAAVDFKDQTVKEVSQLNYVFVYDGGKNVGTLSHLYLLGYKSETDTVTLYLSKKVNLRGAVFFTDYGNIRALQNFSVQYATPVYNSKHDGTAEVVGSMYPSQEGAVTIISDEDDSQQVTIRGLSNRGTGGVFSYKINGPLASHQAVVSPLGNSQLPQNLDGHMNTIYISQGAGDIKYTIFPVD